MRTRLLPLTLAAALIPAAASAFDVSGPGAARRERMSRMGAVAASLRVSPAASALPAEPANAALRGACINEPDCEAAGQRDLAAPSGQAEVSIAVDATGRHVVVGFNDFRGFSLPLISVSGYMFSDDGGRTFTDGGQLPVGGFQAVFGDPDVKYLGGCTFVYSSILINGAGAQTMSLHRSTDCGHTFAGPFEVDSVTAAGGDADKEFMDFDPQSGRLILSWTNFTATAAEISTTYSEDALSANPPTWSARQIVAATDLDGQGSIPRFGNGRNAYVAWRRFPSFYTNIIGFARSEDDGATWSAPVNLTAVDFVTPDQVLGNDRVAASPSMAVDRSRGRHRGNVYVVYPDNDSFDGADIAFQRSTDGGRTFSPVVFLNSRPGVDRAQWWPWVTVDDQSGRLFVFWYDQGVADSGDLSQLTYTFSDDGGRSFSAPVALSDRPFHAGWGNDTSQPNLGDYNQAVAQGGRLYVGVGIPFRPPNGFTDGQPSASMTVPDVVGLVLPNADHPFGAAPVELSAVVARDVGRGANGFVDPGETVALTLTLRNAVTNPLSRRALGPALGVLSTSTPGVVLVLPLSAWPGLAPGASAANRVPFLIRTTAAFVPGTPIELLLAYFGGGARTVLRQTLFTGTPQPTTLFADNFDPIQPGWAISHGAGANTVPWQILTGTPDAPVFCGATSNVAFHANADDGVPGGRNTRWERLFSPRITVPAEAEYVTVEFDVCTDTENDPVLPITAYDGLFLRVTDLTTGRTLRSVLAEAFADEFTTGDLFHYPMHLPRSGDPAYFEDMSAWAGDSGGFKHVRLRLPGMAGSTFQLRFEFTQDAIATCADVRPGHACGVAIDNVLVQSVKSASAAAP